MTDQFKAQLKSELRLAGITKYTETTDGDIVPDPRFPGLVMSQQYVQYSEDASQEERDFAHETATDILLRTREACDAWDNSRPFPGICDAPSNFNIVAEFGEVVMAVSNDGDRGLHFVTWEYGHGRTGVVHGHYTTSYAGAKEDFALRAGLVDERLLLRPEDAPLLYRALVALDGEDVTLTRADEEQIDRLLSDLKQLDPEVVQKAYPAGQDQSLGQPGPVEQAMQGM